MKMETYYRMGTSNIYGVRPQLGGYAVVDVDAGLVIARFAEAWRAENYAIQGCACPMQHHYYHGERCELGAELLLAGKL